MESISSGVSRHNKLRNINIDDFTDRGRRLQDGQSIQQGALLLTKLVAFVSQFVENSVTRAAIAIMPAKIPPLARPLTARDIFRFRPLVVIEAWDRRFDVNLLLQVL